MLTRIQKLYALFVRIADLLRSPLLLIARLYVGWQFFITGEGKLENIDRVVLFFTHLGIPMPVANAYFVSALETVGGLLLLAGLFSRLIAVPLSANMLVAYLTADHEAFFNMFKDPDAFIAATPFLFLVVSLLVLAFGPGVFSLDWVIGKIVARRRGKTAGATSDAAS